MICVLFNKVAMKTEKSFDVSTLEMFKMSLQGLFVCVECLSCALAVPPSLLWLSKPVGWQLAKESSWLPPRKRPAKLSLKSCR